MQILFVFFNKKAYLCARYLKQMNKFEKSLHFISDKILPDSPFYGKIFLVGGCVRDELLGERYSDLDLLINLPNGQREFVEYMCKTYPETCKGPFYYQRYGTTAMDVEIDNTTTLVECVEPHIEAYAEDGVTLLETRFCSLEEDAMRRDYTCNALSKNLSTGEVLDPTGKGIEDLKNKMLRTPAEPNVIFRQDPVRMLRGIRFKHQKGFRLDESAWDAILLQHAEMEKAAPKRLRDELNKMLKARTFGDGINDLLECGLLTYVIPGLEKWLRDETPHPLGDGKMTVWQHTLLALRVMCREHPHTDTILKLTVLVLDLAVVHGKEVAEETLRSAQIGRERVTTIMHYIQQYQRFRSFYRNGEYIGRPRSLPHFITSLSHHKDDFRRMVRALNHGLAQEHQLPYTVFYDKDYVKKERRSKSADDRTPEQIKADRNHRRNQVRRRKRKDTKRKKPEAASTSQAE